ncbi:MAG TPA: hypothetical protein VN920_15290, partial [Pyrinomonadaceae bacterium]|nr:hypothetical protein [Pyrinomonadaceae bacterium]
MRLMTSRPQILSRWRGISHPMRLFVVAGICAAIIIPLLLSEIGYQPLQVLMAILFFEVCLYPTIRYFARKESGLPAMPILCLAYALQFA